MTKEGEEATPTGGHHVQSTVPPEKADAVDDSNRALPAELDRYRIHSTQTGPVQLDMAKQSISLPTARALSDYLQYLNTPLISVSLSRNAIGPEGAKLLGRALITNNTLQFLELEQCQLIGSPYRPEHDGIKALAKGFESTRSALRFINLADNWLQSEGSRILLVALSVHPTLTALDVSKNSLCLFNDASGVLALSYVVTYAKQLCWLSLDENTLAGRPVLILQASLANNASITSLSAVRCGVSPEQLRLAHSRPSVLMRLQG